MPERTARIGEHIVNISGGKDSTACYLLAVARGRPFRAVFADTGHEHPITYEFVRDLPRRAGGAEIEWVKADFSAQIARKRKFVAEKWPEAGVPPERIERALAALHPTGIPMLDLCIWKGRFPSTRVRFCTEELKHRPVMDQVVIPALERGPIIQWTGERRHESRARAGLPRVQTVRWTEPRGRVTYYRPILDWTADDVFALHRRHGVQPNPLYKMGMSRVGCAPCIMARKSELAALSLRFPEEFERLAEWEALVAEASKWGIATFFASDKTPEGADMAREIRLRAIREIRSERPDLAPGLDDEPSAAYYAAVEARASGLAREAEWPDALAVAGWARTSRGGRQYSMLDEIDAAAMCSSHYGLCE